MCSAEDCQISVTSVKNIKYYHRLFYFLMYHLRKFKGKSYVVCTKDTQKVLASFFFGMFATLKCLMHLECFYEKI